MKLEREVTEPVKLRTFYISLKASIKYILKLKIVEKEILKLIMSKKIKILKI